MKVSPQSIFLFHLEARRQLLSPNLSSGKSVVKIFAGRTQHHRTQKRNLNLHRSPSFEQIAPAPIPPDESISIKPTLGSSGAPWGSYQDSSPAPMKAQYGSLRHLPLSCPGCGALTQEVDGDEAGFYTRSRRSVKEYIRRVKRVKASIGENGKHIGAAEEEAPGDGSEQQEMDPASTDIASDSIQRDSLDIVEKDIPFCDRCHNLLHQSKGVPIPHPTINSIADTIAESPYRRNHVYHIVDAADFPLSLIPSIFNRLHLARPRSQNRRSQHDFSTRTTVSFIITKSDLLAPRKEMVDSLMPYFTSVLRQALGRKGEDMRLGNVHLVSAKRGWWTKEIKESIYKRGGGNWMVGKFNVGKSNLFQVLFPKGHSEQNPNYSQLQKEAEQNHHYQHLLEPTASSKIGDLLFSETSLLPPPQAPTPYPTLPLVSSLPGTTASPIRLPFGSPRNPKGELIDLPGLPRGNLSDYVSPEHQRSLLMEHRPMVTQHVLKPGQSLLLGGGLVRITPIIPSDPEITSGSNPNDDHTFLLYPFTPLPAHVTSTEKAVGTQLQQRVSGIKTLLLPDPNSASSSIRSAGTFSLTDDVTKSRGGALLRAGVPLQKLPFRVLATDILVEGVGWIEVVCQVRRRRRRQHTPPPPLQDQDQVQVHREEKAEGDALSFLEEKQKQPTTAQRQTRDRDADGDAASDWPSPEIEIFTPEGRSIGQRRTMGAWMLIHGPRKPGQVGKTQKTGRTARPRRSMKGVKKRERAEKRVSAADSS